MYSQMFPLKRSLSYMLLLAVLISSSVAIAQEEPPVAVSVELSASGFHPGDEFILAGIFDTPENHHITDKEYELFYIEPEWMSGVSGIDTTWPEGIFENEEYIYRGQSVIYYKLKLAENVAPGTYTIPYEYSYQICRELEPETCFLPNGGNSEFSFTVLESGMSAAPSSHSAFAGMLDQPDDSASQNSDNSLENKLSAALEKKSFFAFFLVLLAGVLVSFTPCVYPMIPIIIGFVGNSAGGNKFKGFVLSLFFVLGLIITYAILGVGAGLTGALFGSFMTNPIVLWFIVAIFIALGASMLGAFDISLPSSLQGTLMSGERQGFLGAFVVGAVTGLVASPCAGPPLLVLLGWIGNSGDWVFGFFLMATFALGIGLLFIVIGTFAGALTALPAAGTWMVTIKKGLGVAIFAVALYYIQMLVPDILFTMLVGAFLLYLGMFLGAFAKWEELEGGGKYGKGIGILLVVSGIFYFLLALADLNGVQLNTGGGHSTNAAGTQNAVAENHVPWRVNEYEAVLADAAADGRLILVDFYADWCGVCVELDHKVWNQENVIQATAEYHTLKLDFTRSNADLEQIRKDRGVGGLPTVLILGPDGTERSRFSSFRAPGDVVSWLDKHK